jgi:hypothetical protein
MDRNKLIDKIYSVFPSKKFNLIDHCPCGCCSHIKFRKLIKKDREKIDFYTIGTYADKVLTTIGEVEHYQHFLPRICEMILEGKSRCGISFALLSKLEEADFKNWEKDKIEAILNFLNFYITTEVSDIEEDIEDVQEFLCKNKLKIIA